MRHLFTLLLVAAVGCATPEPQAPDPCQEVTCRDGASCVDGRCVSDGVNNGNNGNNGANNGNNGANNGNNGANNGNNGANNGNNGTNNGNNGANNGNNGANNGGEDAGPDADSEMDVQEVPDVPDDVAADMANDLPEDAPDVRDTPPDEPEACAVATAQAAPATLPVDIIWFVDTSGSMDQETDVVEDKINDFVRFITRSNIEYRVIMVGSNSSVCVPAPLSGGGCPDRDADRYLHVRRSVGSDDGLELVSTTYDQYRAFLREGAQVHIVGVTDDESDWSASRFRVEMGDKRAPGFPNGFTFHSVVAYGDIQFFGCCGWSGCGAGIGQQYLDLSARTGGVTAPICQEDWDPIFEAIGDNVIEGSLLPCNYTIPEPGEFLEVDPERVNVLYTPGQGEPVILPNFDSAEDCRGAGWYYDDPENPAEVVLCPDSCGFVDGSIDIEFGCDIVKG